MNQQDALFSFKIFQ